MRFIEISFSRVKQEIETFLKNEYNKAGLLFSNASPYGQILTVIENLHELSLLYLKNTINNLDLSLPNSMNERIIRNAAIFAGHIPGRSISATGTLKFTLKPNIDLEKEIGGGRVTLRNRSNIKNKTNGLDYALDLGTEKITHNLKEKKSFFVNIIQGKWQVSNNTGAGLPLQTIQVSNPNGKDIENFNVIVRVNGYNWENKRHLYDMIPEEGSVVVRTGFNGGIDVVFGNGAFGQIPPIGSRIDILYLSSDGGSGNIFRRTKNDWTFIDDITDGYGSTLDAEKLFDIDIYVDINFGAEKESFMFTKNMLPLVTNNAVLALPQHFAYEIKKLGVFSHVNAYEKSDTIFITATPNISLFKNQADDYFNINMGAFKLDEYEISKIDKYLKSSGTIQLTKKYKIINPKLSFYAMYVYVIPYSNATDDSINAQITQAVSSYFLFLGRIDRIPKLDIIKALSVISDIHSVDIQFISKKNEIYHKNGKVNQNYQPNTTIGLDPVLGDILIDPDEVPVLRGNWSDRNGIFYSDDMTSTGLKAINIIKKGTVDVKNKFLK